MGRKQKRITNVLTDSPTIKEYIFFEGEQRALIEYTIENSLKANHMLLINDKLVQPRQTDLWFLSWSDLIELKEKVEAGNLLECLKITHGIKDEDFQNVRVLNAFSVYKWVVESIKSISTLEAQELSYEPTEEEKNAGIDELSIFGHSVSVDALASGNILQYEALLNTPYATIFQKLCLEKTKTQINKNFIDNARRKVKAN